MCDLQTTHFDSTRSIHVKKKLLTRVLQRKFLNKKVVTVELGSRKLCQRKP